MVVVTLAFVLFVFLHVYHPRRPCVCVVDDVVVVELDVRVTMTVRVRYVYVQVYVDVMMDVYVCYY